ncbi:hypothetical protein HYS54_00490 [Candidatus Micrarchaeota archaeon]|nr:hypothetical protein [Candidatus Micrarchaeota archaeon]
MRNARGFKSVCRVSWKGETTVSVKTNKLLSIGLVPAGLVLVVLALGINKPIYAFPGVVIMIAGIIGYFAPGGLLKKK